MIKKSIIGLILVLGLLVAAVPVMAGPGGGYGRGGGMHGYGQGYGYHRGYALDEQTLNETATLRGDIYKKRLELDAALSAAEVDPGKVKALQAEINTLQSELSQKYLDAEIQFRKRNPDFRSGYGPGYGMGGGYGPGYCWR